MQGACLHVFTVILMFMGWYFSSTGREEGRVPYVNWGKIALQQETGYCTMLQGLEIVSSSDCYA